jgi:RimJ/RimL family protein N-acetyltransferase
MTSPVALRPVTEADLTYFDRQLGPDTDGWNFFGWRSAAQARRRFSDDGMLSEDHGTLLVDVDGETAGSVSWHAVRYGPRTIPPAYNIGIALLPQHRGHGTGTAAQRALADYLFSTYAVQRIEASTDTDNVVEQRALTKAGFTREGVLRGAQWRAGQWRDLIVYSRLRTDAEPDDGRR